MRVCVFTHFAATSNAVQEKPASPLLVLNSATMTLLNFYSIPTPSPPLQSMISYRPIDELTQNTINLFI
jgi:hypothetical protein